MKYNLKLNIKSITLYEQLTRQSFQQFTGDINQIIPLLYCVIVANNDYRETFAETLKYLFADEKVLKTLSKEIEKQLKFDEQFKALSTPNNEEPTEPTNEETQPLYVSQMLPLLLDCGLSIDYIMNDMRYTDIDTFIRHFNEKEKARLTEKRLFTYLTILPHIDSKKCKSPEQLLPFEWEKENKKEKGLKEIKDKKNKLDDFMNSAPIEFNPE